MVFTVADDGLSIKLTPEFIKELKQIIQRERELTLNASAFYETMKKQSEENNERLETLERKLEAEIQKQSQVCH